MPKFCPECGAQAEGMRFCPECGHNLQGGHSAAAPAAPSDTRASASLEERDVWQGTPDPILSPVAAKTTKYLITNERIKVDSGMLGRSSDSLELFRINDVQVKKSITQRARGRGDLILTSTDPSTPNLTLESIESPDEVCETLRGLIRESRQRHGYVAREMM
jgi:hypothetical protein